MRKLHITLISLLSLCLANKATAQTEMTVDVENAKVKKFVSNVKYSYNSTSVVTYNQYKGGVIKEEDKRPCPAKIDFDNPAQPGTFVIVTNPYNEKDCYTVAVEEGDIEALIYNLTPKQQYEFRVVRIEDEQEYLLNEGIINTVGRVRMLYIPSVANMRDLGGWTLADGSGTTRYGLLYRGAAFTNTATREADVAEMRKMGIMAELYMCNLATAPTKSSLGDDANFLYIHMTDNWGTEGRPSFVPELNSEVKQAFEYIVDNLRQGNAVYFHCTAGADRTGVMAALIEGCVGVCIDNIYKDYELTTYALEDRHKQNLNYRILDSIGYSQDGDIQQCVRNYLINDLGVSQQDIDDLTDMLVEKNTEDPGDATGIDNAKQSTTAAYYDLCGRKSAISRGVTIVRRTDGTAYKITR